MARDGFRPFGIRHTWRGLVSVFRFVDCFQSIIDTRFLGVLSANHSCEAEALLLPIEVCIHGANPLGGHCSTPDLQVSLSRSFAHFPAQQAESKHGPRIVTARTSHTVKS